MIASNNKKELEDVSGAKVSRYRRILPQVIATTVKNLLIIDWWLSSAMPTLIIPALTGLKNAQNRDEFLTMNGVEASWIGSIGYATQMIGALVSSLITDPLGRKRAMVIVNIPYAIGWLMLSHASAVWHIFGGCAMLGFAVGLMESSVITYLGEICEPSTRGILIAYTNITGSLGLFIVYILNAWMPWRSVAPVCLTVPVTSAITLCFIPETPQWLLSKHRTKQAENSLRWLRGWTTKEAVRHEFNKLQRHSERWNACYTCIKQDLHCVHPPPTLIEKLAELKRKQNMKPFAIIIPLFFLAQFNGLWSMRPFIVQIFNAYESPFSSDTVVMFLGLFDNLAKVIFICLIRFVGKRRLFLTMGFGIMLSSFAISCYGFIFLPSGFNSFNRSNQTFHLENPNLPYIPIICLYAWNFCAMCGFASMPWMLLSELFPFKSRGIASGIAAFLNYIMGFISKKTYLNLETTLSLPGTSLFYSVICGAGLIFAYFMLPETENCTLEDIELHFSDNSKKFTDRNIPKSRHAVTEVLSNQKLMNEHCDA